MPYHIQLYTVYIVDYAVIYINKVSFVFVFDPSLNRGVVLVQQWYTKRSLREHPLGFLGINFACAVEVSQLLRKGIAQPLPGPWLFRVRVTRLEVVY